MAQTIITLLLLPVLDGSGVMFRPLLRHLPSHFHPVVVTYPRDQLLRVQPTAADRYGRDPRQFKPSCCWGNPFLDHWR